MNLYDVSVPIFQKTLQNLKGILEKGEAYAESHGQDPRVLLQAKLADDMFPLVRQIQIASDNAKGITARLAGLEPPKMEDTEQTFAELYDRLQKTIDFLEILKREAFEGSEKKVLPFPYDDTKNLFGDEYLLQMTIPNFFFHVVTAYDILRNQGVPLGKNDFIGDLPLKGQSE